MPKYPKNTSGFRMESPLKNTNKNVPYPSNRKGKINPNSEGNTDTKEGRSKSSMVQRKEKASMVKNYKAGYYGA